MVLSIYEDSFFQKNSLTSSYYYARKITRNHPLTPTTIQKEVCELRNSPERSKKIRW